MDEPKSYKYYVIGAFSPIRVAFDAQGLKMGAERPDSQTGHLKLAMDMLSRVETSPDAEEIDCATFDSLCAAVYAKKKHDYTQHLTM